MECGNESQSSQPEWYTIHNDISSALYLLSNLAKIGKITNCERNGRENLYIFMYIVSDDVNKLNELNTGIRREFIFYGFCTAIKYLFFYVIKTCDRMVANTWTEWEKKCFFFLSFLFAPGEFYW